MKFLHCAIMLSYSAGIYQQMSWEQESANRLGKDFTVKIFCPKNVYPHNNIIHVSETGKAKTFYHKIYTWFSIRKEFYKWLINESLKYDIILLRYSVHDPFLLFFLKQVKIPVYLVHHTLELPELNSLGFLGKCRSKADEIIGNLCISKSSGIIGVTNEIILFEKNRSVVKNKNFLIYPNGILFNAKKSAHKKSKIPEILFVASYFFSWHGLDLLLSNLKETNENFTLHIIGNVQKSDIDSVCMDKRIIFHGQLNSQEINEIAKSCWVGLSSFALYRKGMYEACTLKVREYLSLGLPVYSGHKDIFPLDFPFYKIGEPNFDSILEYSRKVRNFSNQDVAEYSEKYISKVRLVDSLINQLENLNEMNSQND
ncbi:glycosyltransferase [Acinetobacter sp. ANC 4193]